MKSAVIYYGKTGFTGKCADVLKSKLNERLIFII
jgi:menaquinone-dependent protoporphyrinogen IX oxidase